MVASFLVSHLPKEESNPWTELLSKVSSPPDTSGKGSVIFLGDGHCGKTSLLQKMTKKDRPSFSSALEYTFLTVVGEFEERINLPVYLLNGQTQFSPLLKFAFPERLNKCVIVLMASMNQPENVLSQLEKWYAVIEGKINEIYETKEIVAGQEEQVRFWQEYVEPVEGPSISVKHNTLLPLEPNVLIHNCGASLVVVLSKCDQFKDLSNSQLLKLQYQVRNFCMSHGAALVYTSAQDDRNTQLLYKYLVHRVHHLPFETPAYIVEKDSVFIPTGWDSNQKLNILKEEMEKEEEEEKMAKEKEQMAKEKEGMVKEDTTEEVPEEEDITKEEILED